MFRSCFSSLTIKCLFLNASPSSVSPFQKWDLMCQTMWRFLSCCWAQHFSEQLTNTFLSELHPSLRAQFFSIQNCWGLRIVWVKPFQILAENFIGIQFSQGGKSCVQVLESSLWNLCHLQVLVALGHCIHHPQVFLNRYQTNLFVFTRSPTLNGLCCSAQTKLSHFIGFFNLLKLIT